MSRPLLLLLLGTLCMVTALLIDEPDPEARLEKAAAHLDRRLASAQAELDRSTEEHARLIAGNGARRWLQLSSANLERERQRTGTTYIVLVGDSVAAWSGDGPRMRLDKEHRLNSEVIIGDLRVKGTRPVWQSPPVRNQYLREGFHPSLLAPHGLVAAEGAQGGKAVGDSHGRDLLLVSWREGAMELGEWLWWRGAMIALGAALLIAALWMICARLSVRTGAGPSLALFILVIIGARWATLSAGHTAPFDRWPLFDPAVAASPLFASLGDLLINSVLLLIIGAFALHASRSNETTNSTPRASVLMAMVLSYAAWVSALITSLVRNSTIDLDLYHIQSIGPNGAAALLATALHFGAWCLTALAVLNHLRDIGPPHRWVFIMLPGAPLMILLAYVPFGLNDPAAWLWPLPVLALIAWGVKHSFGFAQGTLLVGCLAATGAHIITTQMSERERQERAVLADRLALREDPVLEQLFAEKAPRIRRDAALYRLLTSGGYCDPGELERIVRIPYFSGYWERYDLRFFGYDPLGELRCATRNSAGPSLSPDTFALPRGVADMPDLFLEERVGGELLYHGRLAIMPTDNATPAELIIELQPRSLMQGIGFPDLLLAGNNDLMRRTERYAQARYVNGLLMEQRGEVAHPQRMEQIHGEEEWIARDGYEFIARNVGGTATMLLGLPQRGLIDKATTFSYLFSLYGILLLLALAAHALTTGGWPALGIGTKLRAALVLFAIIGMVVFGIGSQQLLTRQFEAREEGAILEKARAVVQELQRRFGDERIDQPTYAGYLDIVLGQVGNNYLTDLTLHAPDGRLLASSRPQMFSAGLLGPRMDHAAFAALALQGGTAFVHEERVGTAAYRSAYVPLPDSKGAPIGYVALPSFSDQARQGEERSQLLVAVVNLFVLLFALSVLLAVFISNWTTRPLDLLKRSLAGMALDRSNQPLQYRGKDEVGELVAVYNQKVEELRLSAERLARSERETAWREMARQVAHEVKNPLTPMKLGIQHFQYTFDAKAPDAKERLDRFTKSMVEQIDTLNGVASAFSQFAQMPAATPTHLDLCEVVRAAVDVFHASPGITITHEEEGPLPVLADREHMLRVLNNLLKNAVQAMPEAHQGRIDVVARREGSRARVEVRDNGAGIPAEARERIFTPSFTTKSSGMGLGLAMVKRMVEQAGGTVRFESAEGEGTTFIVSLPLRDSR
ncbi:MAG TPA: ATP-binding protein [Flavobacteriales bacterium]|nr:ATP-binding protein [Flavobacteriales bacterium]